MIDQSFVIQKKNLATIKSPEQQHHVLPSTTLQIHYKNVMYRPPPPPDSFIFKPLTLSTPISPMNILNNIDKERKVSQKVGTSYMKRNYLDINKKFLQMRKVEREKRRNQLKKRSKNRRGYKKK